MNKKISFKAITAGVVMGLILLAAGKIAKSDPLYNATIVGLTQLAIIILLTIPQINLTPLWYAAITFLAIVPAAYFGGKVASGKSVNL